MSHVARMSPAALFALSLLLLPARALSSQTTAGLTPPHRRHEALTYDPASKRVYLYGGQHVVSNSETPVLADMWSWDGLRWTELAASTGTGMIVHKLFSDGAGSIFAIGIPRAPGAFTMPTGGAVTMRWGGMRWRTIVGDSTPVREGAAGAWDSQRHRFVLFGGLVRDHYAGDTWEFDGHRWLQAATNGPPPMLGAAMAFDSERQVMVLFGGVDTAGHKYGDTWEWNGASWTKVATAGPAARFGAGIAYDAVRHETILFGGTDSSNTKLNDTWRWDGRRWQGAEVGLAPVPRSEGYLAYDSARGIIVMFGGEGAVNFPSLGDTWEWNGVRWKSVP